MKIHDDLLRLGACEEARLWATDKDAAAIWATCPHTDWMIWWIDAAKPDGYERDLRLIAADIAESVLPIYERDYPGDDRPRKAIAAAAVAWAEWQEKADALEPAIYLHHPNEASTVYEGLNASAAALIKSVKP